MSESCDIMSEGEILNEGKSDFKLFHATLYGDRVLTAKLSKRVSCAIKHLPIRVEFNYEHNTIKALEAGVQKDPTLVLDGVIFIEGLIQTEEIVEKFENLIK